MNLEQKTSALDVHNGLCPKCHDATSLSWYAQTQSTYCHKCNYRCENVEKPGRQFPVANTGKRKATKTLPPVGHIRATDRARLEARYFYNTPEGELDKVNLCWRREDGKKSFSQREYLHPVNAWGVKCTRPWDLYGIERLIQARTEAVHQEGMPQIYTGIKPLVVEGEKCAEALVEPLKGKYIPLTAFGGAKGMVNADWSRLQGLDVVVWPDADAAGAESLDSLLLALARSEVRSISVVRAEHGAPDAADLVEKGENTAHYIQEHLELLDMQDLPIDTVQQLITALSVRLRLKLRYNENSRKPVYVSLDRDDKDAFTARTGAGAALTRDMNHHTLEKEEVLSIKDLLETQGVQFAGKSPSLENFFIQLQTAALRDRFSPLGEWLSDIEWDGVSRIDTFLEQQFDTGETPIEIVRWVSRYIFLVPTMRLLEPGTSAHIVPILYGPQGLGKTRFVRNLFPRNIAMDIVNTNFRFSDKQQRDIEAIAGKSIILFSERIKNKDLAYLKAFIDQDYDNVLLPYGRRSVSLPRTCLFIADTNKRQHCPNDPSGNRRFMTVELKAYAGGRLEADVRSARTQDELESVCGQLWAEAVHRARGYLAQSDLHSPLHPTQELMEIQDEWQLNFYDANVELEAPHITEWFINCGARVYAERTSETKPGLTIHEIGASLDSYTGIPVEHAPACQKLLSRLGWSTAKNEAGKPKKYQGVSLWQPPIRGVELEAAITKAKELYESGNPLATKAPERETTSLLSDTIVGN